MSQVINTLIKPLEPYLYQDDVMELSIVDDSHICIERDSIGYEKIADSRLTFAYWENLCHVLANNNGVVFDAIKQPRLSAILPGGHRIEAMLGNNVDSKISVSIRVKRKKQREIQDFGLDNKIANALVKMVNDGCNCIISGGTSSGKTSFLNALLQHINRDKRVLTIEDAREVNLPDMQYSAQYIVSRNEQKATIGYPQMIDHLMRSRPDMVIIGEISVSNAFPALRLLNTGHKGFLCTIHANSPELALNGAFPQNIQMSGHETTNVSKWLRDMVDIVIQLKSGKHGKMVTEIYTPKDKNWEQE